MRNKTLAASIAVMLCAGCVNGSLQLPQLPPLPSAPGSGIVTGAQTLNLSMSNGQVHTVPVPIPPKTCNATQYVSGYRNGYVSEWNNRVTQKSLLATADQSTRLHAATLVAPPTLMQTGQQSLQQTSCLTASLQSGFTAGQAQAHNDFVLSPLNQ